MFHTHIRKRAHHLHAKNLDLKRLASGLHAEIRGLKCLQAQSDSQLALAETEIRSLRAVIKKQDSDIEVLQTVVKDEFDIYNKSRQLQLDTMEVVNQNLRATVENQQSEIKALESSLTEYTNINTELDQPHHETVELEVQTLRAIVRNQEGEIKKLQSTIRNHTHVSKEADQSHIEAMEMEMHALRATVQKQQNDMENLQAAINHQNAVNNEPDQSRLESMVRCLHYKIQNLQVNYLNPSPILSMGRNSMNLVSYKLWWRHWNCMDRLGKKSSIHACIFHVLHERVFTQPVFGLAIDTENVLKAFEASLNSAPASSAPMVSEWRKHTVLLAKLMQQQHHIVGLITKQLYDELKPVMTPQEQRDRCTFWRECFNEVRDLVQDAVQLALTIRSSSKIYQIIAPEPGDLVASWHKVDYVHEDDGDTDRKLVVNEVRFGALVIRPNLVSRSTDEWEVLEKALVTARYA